MSPRAVTILKFSTVVAISVTKQTVGDYMRQSTKTNLNKYVLFGLILLGATVGSAQVYAQVASSDPQAQADADQAAVKAARKAVRAAVKAAFNARQTQPIYRYVGAKGYHRFALSADGTGIPSGFTLEGEVFDVYQAEYAKTTALYRCHFDGHEFLSVDSACEGQIVRGVIGYVSTVQVADLKPLYRLTQNGDHLTSTDTDEGLDAGYTLEGILGFVP